MYQPPHHRETRLEVMHALIRAHPLGLLISSGDGSLLANPIPFLLDEDVPPNGRLRAHCSRGNAQWRHLADNPEADVLIVFQGANTYITPSWYATKRQTGKVVPTWNYAIVQARGKARIIEDRDWLAEQVAELTGTHEAARAEPWHVTDAPDAFVEAQIKGIVGISIDIATIEGKWKVSQNRPYADRTGVAQGLDVSHDAPGTAVMAGLVREFGKKPSGQG